jgi:uncharacterized RDD family membrane protein YckC
MASDEWFYLEDSKSIGPQDTNALAHLLHIAKISLDTPVWKLGAEKWLPLREAIPAITEIPPPLPSEQRDTSIRAPALTPIKVPASSQPLSVPEIASVSRQGGWTDTSPHPWRRYFARMLDGSSNGLFTIFAVSFAAALLGYPIPNEFLSVFDNRVVGSVAVLIAAIPLNALLIGYTGGTLGKWLFGVRIVRIDDTPVGFKVALIREALVWARGLGLGIPIVSLFTCFSAFNTLKKDGRTSWDKELSAKAVHRASGTAQVLGILGGVVALGALFAVIGVLEKTK